MRTVVLTGAACLLAIAAAGPAWSRDLVFWNQTEHEMTEVYLAPAGTQNWSGNMTLSDKDHSVSGDERLKLPGVRPGVYDVRMVDTNGRTCVVPGVAVKGEGKVAFSITEDQLGHCTAAK